MATVTKAEKQAVVDSVVNTGTKKTHVWKSIRSWPSIDTSQKRKEQLQHLRKNLYELVKDDSFRLKVDRYQKIELWVDLQVIDLK